MKKVSLFTVLAILLLCSCGTSNKEDLNVRSTTIESLNRSDMKIENYRDSIVSVQVQMTQSEDTVYCAKLKRKMVMYNNIVNREVENQKYLNQMLYKTREVSAEESTNAFGKFLGLMLLLAFVVALCIECI